MEFQKRRSRISIECTDKHIRLVRSQRSDHAVLIEQALVFEWPADVSLQIDPDAAGIWFKQQLTQVDKTHASNNSEFSKLNTTAVVARDSFILKTVTLPTTDIEVALEMARYQVATHFSTPIDELSIAHVLSDAGDQTKCMMMALPNDARARWQTFCMASGLKLTAIVPRSIAVSEYLKASVGHEQSIAIIHEGDVDSAEAELCFVDANGLQNNASVALPTDQQAWPNVLAGHIRRIESTNTSSAKSEAASYRVVLLGEFPDGFSESLGNTLNTKVQNVDLNTFIQPTDPLSAENNQASIGLLAHALVDESKIDFLGDQHRHKATAKRSRRIRHVAVAAAIITVGLFGLSKYHQHKLDQTISHLVSQRRAIDHQVAQGQADVRPVG